MKANLCLMMQPVGENRRHFHQCMIEFITANFRLSKWHWISTWNDFHIEFRCPSFELLSPKELKEEFETRLLPKIFTYELSHEQRSKLESLNTYQVCGPKLIRMPDGYSAPPVTTGVKQVIGSKLQENVDFTTPDSEMYKSSRVAMALLGATDWDTKRMHVSGNMPIRRCLSFMLQDEDERLQESLLSWGEASKRWKGGYNIATHAQVTEDVTFMEKVQKRVRNYFEEQIQRASGRGHRGFDTSSPVSTNHQRYTRRLDFSNLESTPLSSVRRSAN
ncbi:unnamed protein product [Hermetia illucens]|uniref:Uncharacterized protein n=1 Tax=Hermetia illucens TaxID=343691 RepID=A0A7R8YQY3_HERIL|nr:uncharacterized protein LOC119648667 [Hermetia illucens]CAD7081886.1 unnamed protein product [Hermetia illucens]